MEEYKNPIRKSEVSYPLIQNGAEYLAKVYKDALLKDVIPFWLKFGMDRENGGIFTALDQDGTILDTDKSVWFQGRAGWMFATLYNTVSHKKEWLDAAKSCVEFSQKCCHSSDHDNKMWFTVTKKGEPLRMRRYVYSESFAAISYASLAQALKDEKLARDAIDTFARYLKYSFEPGFMVPKFEPTRPAQGIGSHMIAIITAQELRYSLGDVTLDGKLLSDWIMKSIEKIQKDFLKHDLKVLMETVAPDGSIIEHTDGLTLNPGHAIECAWFFMQEGRIKNEPKLIQDGLAILDYMWERGWDKVHGGLLYFVNLRDQPVQEYWHDMKFWWPHCEAIIATTLAFMLTGLKKYAVMHQLVHDWSFKYFPDPVNGEWFGYLHRDGSLSQRAKGNMFKGPFHLPRMLWFLAREFHAFKQQTPPLWNGKKLPAFSSKVSKKTKTTTKKIKKPIFKKLKSAIAKNMKKKQAKSSRKKVSKK